MPSNSISPTLTPTSESYSDAPSTLIIPAILFDSKPTCSPSDKVNTKSPLTTESKSRTGIPISIGTHFESTTGVTPQSGNQSAGGVVRTSIATKMSMEESDLCYFEVCAELDDEDYLTDEFAHVGHTSALSFPKDPTVTPSPESVVSSQPSSVEHCLIRKGFRVEVREYNIEKAEDSDRDDESEFRQQCYGWLKFLRDCWCG